MVYTATLASVGVLLRCYLPPQ